MPDGDEINRMSNDPANLDPSGAAPPDPDAVHFAKVTAGVYRSADPRGRLEGDSVRDPA